MKHGSSFPVLCFVLVSFFSVFLVSAQTCLNNGNFIPNSTYDANLRLIISSLPSNVLAREGFYNGSVGYEPNRVYAIGMCIPGSTSHDCSDCIKTAVDGLVKNCPKQTEAYWWKGETILCLVRYANNSLSADPKPRHMSYNTENINSNLTEFMEIWQGLVDRMIVEASTPKSTPSSSNNYYKADVSALTPYQDIYAMMQCTPDLSSADCYKCLRKSTRNYQSCCGQKSGGTVFGPSCFFRWEMYSFSKAFGINTTASPSPSPPMQPDNGSVKISTRAITKIIVPIIVSVFIAIILVPFARKSTKFLWRKEPYQDVVDYDQSGITNADALQLDFKTIEAATDNFARSNKLGQGGFGEVFKGTLLNGTEVAVKRLSKASEQGAEEFKNEVAVVAKLHHRNLVRLLGFCIEGEEKILVYELVANKSLDYFLFDPMKQIQLDWKRRYNIIQGIARAILYLHQDSRLTVIHRDLKASNILLDANMNPKIADFGMARIFGMDQSGANTSRIVGTRGYMPPEYVMQGLFSTKSDVYSFGVLVLEIISGRNNRFFQESDTTVENLVTYAWRLWRKGSPLELLDPTISKNCQTHQAAKCIHIALLCVQEDPNDRPALSTVMLMLTSNSVSLTVPQPPGFFFPNRHNQERDGFVSSHSTIRSSSQTINDVTISDLQPR